METALGIMGDGMMLGFKEIDFSNIPTFHKGLHEALQPVFRIMEEEFPKHKIIISHGSAEIIQEHTEGAIFSDKALEGLTNINTKKFLKDLYEAALPVVEEMIKDVKKE